MMILIFYPFYSNFSKPLGYPIPHTIIQRLISFDGHPVPKRDLVGIRIFARACDICTDNCKDPFGMT